MGRWSGLRTAVFGATALVLLLSGPARADDWKAHSAQCNAIFQGYRDAPAAQLSQCLGRWYELRALPDVKASERSMVAEAAAHLYKTGDRPQQHLGRTVLARLGVTPPALEAPKKAEEKVAKKAVEDKPKVPARKKYVPDEASDAQMKKAKKIRTAGFKDYKKGRHQAAIKKFEAAIDAWPGFTQALYDAACTHALLGHADQSVEYLRKLVDIGTKESIRKAQHARVDKDFVSLRDNPNFRDATGYVRVKLVNGVGEFGEDEIDRITKTIGKLQHHLAAKGPDKADRTRPIIWHKEHRQARDAAYIFQKVLNHPNTKFNPIDWETDFDVIISWGDEIKKDDHGDPIVKSYAPDDPEEAEKMTDEMLYEQDKALREPDAYARKVDHTISTPERMEQRVESSERRVESTVKTIEKTGKKIGDIFK